MIRRLPWFRLSVLHATILISGTVAAQFLPGRNDVSDLATACYWTIEILPFVECGERVQLRLLTEIFYNIWLLPLYGIAFAASAIGALFEGSLADMARQLGGLSLVALQVTLIIVFIWGGLKRLLRLVAYTPETENPRR